jgi:hypothetical protein
MTPTGPTTVVLAAIEVVVGASSSRPSLATTGVLVGIALVLPLGAWLLLGARERVRRRIA